MNAVQESRQEVSSEKNLFKILQIMYREEVQNPFAYRTGKQVFILYIIVSQSMLAGMTCNCSFRNFKDSGHLNIIKVFISNEPPGKKKYPNYREVFIYDSDLNGCEQNLEISTLYWF